MPTFSIKTKTQDQKEALQKRFMKWKDIQPGTPTMFDAFVALLTLGEQGIDSIKSMREPGTVTEALDSINCNFLKYEEFDFKCFERFDAKKKPDPLGTDPDKIIIRCDACKAGKAQSILEQYQKKVRGQNINGILSMVKQFQAFAQSGMPSTISFCNRIPSRQVITGKKSIHCGKVQMQIVPIDPTCKDPKCQYFQEFTIKVEHEFPTQALALIEGIAEDYQRLEDLSPGERKEVDADQEPEGEEEQ